MRAVYTLSRRWSTSSGVRVWCLEGGRARHRRAPQRDGRRVHWQPVEPGPVARREAFELGQRTDALKGLRVQRQRRWAGVDARAAAARLLGRPDVRRAVGPQEELGVAARGRGQERTAVRLGLQDGQAVHVRPEPALEQRRAVVQQVVRGDGGGHVRRCGFDELDRLRRRDVLHHHPERRVRRQQWPQRRAIFLGAEYPAAGAAPALHPQYQHPGIAVGPDHPPGRRLRQSLLPHQRRGRDRPGRSWPHPNLPRSGTRRDWRRLCGITGDAHRRFGFCTVT